jgi:hypothetical protein
MATGLGGREHSEEHCTDNLRDLVASGQSEMGMRNEVARSCAVGWTVLDADLELRLMGDARAHGRRQENC